MKEKKAQKGVGHDFEEVVKKLLATPPMPKKPSVRKAPKGK